jgi:sulfotransferase
MKSFYYLAGLPRSGASLLSTLLNQNPNVYVSPLSAVNDVLFGLHDRYINSENALLQRDINGVCSVGRNLLSNYYEHIDKPVVIDRAKSWGTPPNIELIKIYINGTPKIIYTARSIPDVLASYLQILGHHLEIDMENDNWAYDATISVDDNKCDYLMKEGGSIRNNLETIKSMKNPENAGVFHIVEYNDLLTDPQKTLTAIYEFLDLPNYIHEFNNITGAYVYNEKDANLPEALHHVREKLEPRNHNVVLSDYVLSKYSGLETWRNL